MYLPWLPLNESVGFNFGADSAAEGQKSAGEDTITIIITTKNYGIVKILLYNNEQGYSMDVNCSDTFPKERFNEAVKVENALHLSEAACARMREKRVAAHLCGAACVRMRRRKAAAHLCEAACARM